jgi:hypothetical protein
MEVIWQAVSAWASMEPKSQPNILSCPDELTHEIEVAWPFLDNLPGADNFDSLSDFRQHAMAKKKKTKTFTREGPAGFHQPRQIAPARAYGF